MKTRQVLRKIAETAKNTEKAHPFEQLIVRLKAVANGAFNPVSLALAKRRLKPRSSIEAWHGLLRMEIFAGTYMRSRLSPCVAFNPRPESAKMSCFSYFKRIYGFLFTPMSRKKAQFLNNTVVRL
jgi:hypothetical protein